ncbi:hypothetical protein [Klebsiella phage phiKp_7-2]|nr:hypothetical protein [Klebsiella phage phiKp_7-2]
MSLICHVTSIPAMLEKAGGSMRKLSSKTGINTMTILKFREDYNCERHAIVNGRLMTWRETSSADFKDFIRETCK